MNKILCYLCGGHIPSRVIKEMRKKYGVSSWQLEMVRCKDCQKKIDEKYGTYNPPNWRQNRNQSPAEKDYWKSIKLKEKMLKGKLKKK